MNRLEPALESLSVIFGRLDAREVALFLDYDGTLTPIAAQPDLAELPETMRRTLRALAKVCHVAVISGRGLADVRQRVGLDTLAYAGSHGFEIVGPPAAENSPDGGTAPEVQSRGFENISLEKGQEFRVSIERVEAELKLRMGRIEGLVIERKPLGIGVHYRHVADHDLPTLSKHMNSVLDEFRGFSVTAGKKIYDIRPDINWDKGEAVLWMLDQLKRRAAKFSKRVAGIYIGDDTTDEDAFRAIRPEHITIAVQATPHQSAAEFSLKDPDAVQAFLDAILENLSQVGTHPTKRASTTS